MDSSLWIDTINLGWSIIYTEGLQAIVSKQYRNSFSEEKLIVFILANSEDPDEMPHYAAFHLALHCLQKYQFMGLHYTKGEEKIALATKFILQF